MNIDVNDLKSKRIKTMNNDDLEQSLFLRNIKMQAHWMRCILNTMHSSSKYEKYRTKIVEIKDALKKVERAILHLEREILIEQAKGYIPINNASVMEGKLILPEQTEGK